MMKLKYDEDISQLTFTAFDIETTGLKPGSDKIVEIGGVKFHKKNTFAYYETLINPGMSMPEAASRINGITDDMLVDKPPVEKVLPNFLQFISNSVIIAHNARFDLSFLNFALSSNKMPYIDNPLVDTLHMARNLLPGERSHSLQNLAAKFNIDPGNAHRARDDSEVCKQVFYKLLEMVPGGKSMPLDKLLKLCEK